MDALNYKGFYKNNTAKRFEDIKAASHRQTKQQRDASRYEMRQINRNISDSEEENAAPVRAKVHQSNHCRTKISKDTNAPPVDKYQHRMHRLREYQEQKQLLQQKQASRRPPFVPYVLSGRLQEQLSGVRKKTRPLRELPLTPQEHSQIRSESPVPAFKMVQPRVDCWLRRGPNKDVESTKRPTSGKKNPVPPKLDRFAQPIAAVKSISKLKESKKPISKPAKTFLTVNQSAQPETILFTSTARKPKKPLAFKFDPLSRAIVAKTKNTLTVADANKSLFDGISPIDKEPTPKKSSNVLLNKNAHEGDSIWEPQPVAAILEATGVGCEPGVILVDDSPVADTLPESSRNKPALNESFTICDGVAPVGGTAEDSIFGCRPIIMPETGTILPATIPPECDGLKLDGSIVSIAEQTKPSSSPALPNKTLSSTRRRSSIWSVTLVSQENGPSPGLENRAPSVKECTDTAGPPSALSRKRSSLVFSEETIRTVISPSVSNLTLEEVKDIGKCISKRRSSSPYDGPVAIEENDAEEQPPSGPPEEVLAKTNFYYQKVDCELARLQALCNEYAPFLEGEDELNDHCKGLIIAAQGQTNILINKKLTKFRDLIGHYKNKWNDRKVRNDDLDGFWLMLSLDLENLDKRFAELRTLRENNWQESEPEPPPKVKKLQGGGGVKKPAKKAGPGAGRKPSSSIAELIRKARQEQLKQKAAHIDLGELTETVTLVKTPTKKSVRIAATPKRQSLRKRSSLCTGCTPTIIHWDEGKSPASRKRRTIFPEIAKPLDNVKSILKTPNVTDKRRAKSVLFLDSGLDTPQTRRRQSSRRVVDTPKPKIKFNDELEIEHIDNLAARTPSRLDQELQKRRRQSLMLFSATDPDDGSKENEELPNVYPGGTPRNTNSVKRRNRSYSRNLSAAIWDVESDELLGVVEQEVGSSGKRVTRSSTNNSRKRTLDFS